MPTPTVERLSSTRASGTLDDASPLEVRSLADRDAAGCECAARRSWLHGRVHVVVLADGSPVLVPGCDHLTDATVVEALHRYRLHQVA